MKLLKFEANNLFSLGKVSFEVPKGLTLVTGYSKDEGSSNGAGKSSLANKGIIWTLYGATPGGTRGDSVSNKHRKGKTFGKVEFEKDDNMYEVIRSRPSNLTLKNLTSGTDLSLKEVKETQLILNKIIGRTYNTFIQTDFFGQGRSSNFANHPSSDRFKVLEDILPIEMLEGLIIYTKMQIEDVNARSVNELHAYNMEQAGIKVREENLERDEKRIIDYKTNLEISIASTDRTIKDFTQEVKLHPDLIEEWTKDRNNFTKKIEENTNRRINDKIEHSRTLSDLKGKRDHLVVLLKGYMKGICSFCNQEIKEVHGLKNTTSIKITMFEDDIKRLNTKIDKNDRELDKFNKVKIGIAKLFRIEQHISKLIELRQELAKGNPSLVNDIERQRKKLSETKLKAFKLHENVQQLEKEKRYLTFWLEVYSKDVRMRLVDAACSFLNDRVAYHLHNLGNSQITVDFNTIKILASGSITKAVNLDVKSATGGQEYKLLSGGEQQMVNFAIGLALSDLAITQTEGATGLLILDEPFSMLDERNSESIVNYLTTGFKDKEAILLISNEEHLKGLILNRIHVEKEKGVTRICQETTN